VRIYGIYEIEGCKDKFGLVTQIEGDFKTNRLITGLLFYEDTNEMDCMFTMRENYITKDIDYSYTPNTHVLKLYKKEI